MRVVITIFLLVVLGLSMTVGLDESAMKIHDASFERAMVAFGLAKGLNAVISLIQGTELSFTPIGVGLTFSIGEVLDPFNDMVERFSWVMLFASVSLGIQKLLLILSSKLFLQIAMGVSVFLTLVFMWIKKIGNHHFFIFSMKIFLLLVLLRFGTILFVYTSEFFYNSVLQEEYVSSNKVIEETKSRLEDMQSKNETAVATKKESGVFSSMSSKYNSVVQSLNISAQLSSLQSSIDEASRKIINLITIFIANSVLIPLLFVWFFLVSVRFIFGFKFDNYDVSLMLNKGNLGV